MGLVVLVFVLAFLFSIPVMIAIPKTDRTGRFVGMGLAQLLAEAVVVFRGYRRTGAAPLHVFSLRWPSRAQMTGMLLQWWGALVLSAGLAILLMTIWPMTTAWKEANEKILKGGGSFGAALLFIVLLGPLAEELLFRGLILGGLLQNYSRGLAVGISALLFAVVHLDPWKFLPVLVSGMVLAWWRVASDSLWPGIIGHSLTNAVGVVGYEITRRHPGHQSTALPEVSYGLAACAAGTVLLAIGAWLMVRSRVRQELPAVLAAPL